MNYPWRNAILSFARGEDDGRQLRRAVLTLAENYPAAVLNANLNLLSSHDVPRALTALVDPTDGEREDLAQRTMTAAQLAMGKARLRLATFLQFTLPGAPCIYYGDEAGMTGYRDPFNRGYYPWGKEDLALQGHYRAPGAAQIPEPGTAAAAAWRCWRRGTATLCSAAATARKWSPSGVTPLPCPGTRRPQESCSLGDPRLPSMGLLRYGDEQLMPFLRRLWPPQKKF